MQTGKYFVVGIQAEHSIRARQAFVRQRVWPAAVAGAALFVSVTTPPSRVLVNLGAFAALLVMLLADHLQVRSAALLGFVAVLIALAGSSLANTPPLPLLALAAASLSGVVHVSHVSQVSQGSQGRWVATACITLVAAATASGALLIGDLAGAAVIAVAAMILGFVVVIPAQILASSRDTPTLMSQNARSDRISGTPDAAAGHELERARVEALSAHQALLHEAELRKKAELRALESQRTKDAFLAVMSHELRTPLNQILGYSEILLEESDGAEPEQIRGDAERIRLASRNLLEILDNTLDLANIEAGREAVQLEDVPLYDFIQEVADRYVTPARTRDNTLRVRCAEDIGVMYTDRIKLRKILGALLANGCKFTQHGTIRLAVTRNPLVMTFEISDTGVGIPAEALERIFEPFYQVDGSPTRRHDGAGVGLSLCQHFGAMLGGELRVQSEAGKGSTFTLSLPLTLKDPRAEGHIVMSFASSGRFGPPAPRRSAAP